MSPHMDIPGCTCDLRLIDWRHQLVVHLNPFCRYKRTPLETAEQKVVAAR